MDVSYLKHGEWNLRDNEELDLDLKQIWSVLKPKRLLKQTSYLQYWEVLIGEFFHAKENHHLSFTASQFSCLNYRVDRKNMIYLELDWLTESW